MRKEDEMMRLFDCSVSGFAAEAEAKSAFRNYPELEDVAWRVRVAAAVINSCIVATRYGMRRIMEPGSDCLIEASTLSNGVAVIR
jgi:hypothetical protein